MWLPDLLASSVLVHLYREMLGINRVQSRCTLLGARPTVLSFTQARNIIPTPTGAPHTTCPPPIFRQVQVRTGYFSQSFFPSWSPAFEPGVPDPLHYVHPSSRSSPQCGQEMPMSARIPSYICIQPAHVCPSYICTQPM